MTIDATKPQDDDIISQHPADERSMRGSVLANHDSSGRHDRVEMADKDGATPAGLASFLTLWSEGKRLFKRLGTGTVVDVTTPTGTVRSTILSAAPAEWLLLNGDTLGSAGSGATQAGTDYQDLYEAFWDNWADTEAPVSTGRGASASADFAANKTLTMPDARGRMVLGAGTGAGLTARTLGADVGSENAITVTHSHGPGTLAADSAGAHTHTVQGKHTTSGSGDRFISIENFDAGDPDDTDAGAALSDGAHTHPSLSGNSANAGSPGTDANTPAAFALSWIVKL